MAFLDNSGDIVLDAVLTDAGRKRMAEGKFNITKYAFGDEEINYSLFNSSHPSGSAFYDLEIMQTPILEAFTNNTSTMSSKLMSLNDNNFLYLPILKLNEKWGLGKEGAGNNPRNWSGRVGAGQNATDHQGKFIITCDASTEDLFKYSPSPDDSNTFLPHRQWYEPGVILGAESATAQDATFICVDQGVAGTDTGLSVVTPFPEELRETAYIIKMDHRLGRLATHPGGYNTITSAGANIVTVSLGGCGNTQFLDASCAGTRTQKPYAYVDDDNIASYYITSGASDMFQSNILNSKAGNIDAAKLSEDLSTTDGTSAWYKRQAFQSGPVGSRLMFTVRAQDTVKLSYDLFDTATKALKRASAVELDGGTSTWVVGNAGDYGNITVRYIDSVITVTGVTTGHTLDIPVRYVKKAPA